MIGIVIATHSQLGDALIDTAEFIIGNYMALPIQVLTRKLVLNLGRASVHPRIQNEHAGCPIQKWAIFVLIKAAQGFSVRRTPVRRSRKPAENAEQGKKGHLWMGTK